MALGRNAQLDPPLFQPFLAICTRRRLPRQMISLDKRLLREQASMRRAKWETACGERDSAHGPREGVITHGRDAKKNHSRPELSRK